MFSIGRICMKIAGRDAGKYCVVVDNMEEPYVMIDGMTRKKRCNKKHLEVLSKTVSIKKGADTATIIASLKKEGFAIADKKASTKERKEKTQRPIKQKIKKEKPVKQKKPKQQAKSAEKETKKQAPETESKKSFQGKKE